MNAETTTFSDLPRKNVNIMKNLNYTQGLIAKSILVFQTLSLIGIFFIDSFRKWSSTASLRESVLCSLSN